MEPTPFLTVIPGRRASVERGIHIPDRGCRFQDAPIGASWNDEHHTHHNGASKLKLLLLRSA